MSGEWVRAIRIYHRMTQKKFAAVLGVSASYIANVETGYCKVSDKLKMRIIQTFGFDDGLKDTLTKIKELEAICDS